LARPRQLAAEYQAATGQAVSHAAILKHFKKLDIPRNLAEKIKAKADAMVTQAMVTAKVTGVTTFSERDIVEANAGAIAIVRLAHRRDIQRSRCIVMRLFDELHLQAGNENVELLEQLGEVLRAEDVRGQDRLNDLYHKIISLPGRAKTMKDLGESLRVLVALERQAFGLSDYNKSTAQLLQDLLPGERFIVLPRIDELINGIYMVRKHLKSTFIFLANIRHGFLPIRITPLARQPASVSKSTALNILCRLAIPERQMMRAFCTFTSRPTTAQISKRIKTAY
jgi:hypothetical protein